jgi:Ricin-type beta-trefoil lectin domain-like
MLREYPEAAGVTRTRPNLKGNTAMNTHPSPHDAPDQPARAAGRPRRLGRFRRATLAAAVLASAGGLMLAASGIAFASVDQTSPQWAELGSLASTTNQANQVTAVYTIQNVAEPGTEVLEDNGNNMNAGGTVDVWSKWYQTANQDPHGGTEITQANDLWEYVPDNASDGGSIVDGPGELINRQSGLCLDVANNNTSDGAAIDQWGCNGGSNQQWIALDLNGHFMLQPMLDQVTGFLGVGNGSTCTTSGDGDSVYVRTTGTDNNPCDEWDIQQASYDFATNSVSVTGYTTKDDTSYGCLTGDTLRGKENAPDYDNLSGPGVTPDLYNLSSQPGIFSGIDYVITNPDDTEPGQVMLYCDPASTTP